MICLSVLAAAVLASLHALYSPVMTANAQGIMVDALLYKIETTGLSPEQFEVLQSAQKEGFPPALAEVASALLNGILKLSPDSAILQERFAESAFEDEKSNYDYVVTKVATSLYSKGMQKGHLASLTSLAKILYTTPSIGTLTSDIRRSPKLAFDLYSTAAKHGDHASLFNMGLILAEGITPLYLEELQWLAEEELGRSVGLLDEAEEEVTLEDPAVLGIRATVSMNNGPAVPLKRSGKAEGESGDEGAREVSGSSKEEERQLRLRKIRERLQKEHYVPTDLVGALGYFQAAATFPTDRPSPAAAAASGLNTETENAVARAARQAHRVVATTAAREVDRFTLEEITDLFLFGSLSAVPAPIEGTWVDAVSELILFNRTCSQSPVAVVADTRGCIATIQRAVRLLRVLAEQHAHELSTLQLFLVLNALHEMIGLLAASDDSLVSKAGQYAESLMLHPLCHAHAAR